MDEIIKEEPVTDEVEDSQNVYFAIAGAARSAGHVCAPSLWQKVIARCVGLRPDLQAYDTNRRLLSEALASCGYEMAKPDGAFYLFIKGILQAEAVPEEALPVKVDVMPIDLCAREVLALKDTEGTVFHIMNSDPPCLSQIVAAFGDQLRMVSDAEFDRVLSEKRDRINPELLGVVMDYLHKSRYAPPQVHPTNHQTEQALKAIGFRTEVSSIKLVLQDFLR